MSEPHPAFDPTAAFLAAVAARRGASPHLVPEWAEACREAGGAPNAATGPGGVTVVVDHHGNLRARTAFVAATRPIVPGLGGPVLELPGEARPGGGLVLARTMADAREAGRRLAASATPGATRGDAPVAIVTGHLLAGDELDEAFVRGVSGDDERRIVRTFRNVSLHARLDEGGAEGLLRRGHGGATVRRHLRHLRRLERDGATIERLEGAAIDATAIARMGRILRDGPQAARGVLPIDAPSPRAFALALARRDLLRAWIVRAGDEDAAFLVASLGPGRWRGEWTGYRERYRQAGVGRAVLHAALDDAMQAGARAFDFGLGDADYKRFWADESLAVERLAVALPGSGVRGQAVLGTCRLAWRAARSSAIRRLAALPGLRRVTGFDGPAAAPRRAA